ncbi:MAG TPA: hypothetical protein VE913_04225 [Longimicrobium sp.]|nr:hypothetical protein [Longimicrobium sp.]
MIRMKIVVLGAAATLLGGCAPSFGAGVGSGPCARPDFQAGMRRSNITAVNGRVSAMKARYMRANRFVSSDPNRWKQLATGECR